MLSVEDGNLPFLVGSNGVANTPQTLSVPRYSDVQEGDLLIMFQWMSVTGTNVTFSAITGWTPRVAQSIGTLKFRMSTKVATASEPSSYSATTSATNTYIKRYVIFTYRNAVNPPNHGSPANITQPSAGPISLTPSTPAVYPNPRSILLLHTGRTVTNLLADTPTGFVLDTGAGTGAFSGIYLTTFTANKSGLTPTVEWPSGLASTQSTAILIEIGAP